MNQHSNSMKYLERIKEKRWIILILALAAFLRFYQLGFQSAWLDEVHTLKESNPVMPFSQFHKVIMAREGIPHLYFMIVRFLSDVFGSSIYVARIPSAIGGVLTVWFVYLLGKELCNKRAGQISALLLTLNFFHIAYSQEARSYVLLAFFATAAFYYLVRFVRVASLKYALLLGLFSGLITHMQPIGLVNVVALYFIVFFVLAFNRPKDTGKFILLSVASMLAALIVFIPVYQIVQKVSVIDNPWIPALSWDSMFDVLVSLSGNSKIVLVAIVLSILYFFVTVARSLSNKAHRNLSQNRLLFGFVILFVWVFSELAGIVLKSYFGDSIILARYFMAIVPAMMLFLGIGIELIKNKMVKIAVSLVIPSGLAFALFSPVNYYTTLTKSQYDKVCEKVMQNNAAKDKVVSNWGWLLTYYFSDGTAVVEMPLDRYVENLKSGSMGMGSFWYIDGNERSYAPNSEHRKYLKDNFIVGEKIFMTDAWAYHFILIEKEVPQTKGNSSNPALDLKNFKNATFDETGAIVFDKNKMSRYPQLFLEKGKYKLLVKGISLPEKPINNENAHFKLLIDGKNVGEFTLSEKKGAEANVVHFVAPESKAVYLTLAYDNHTAVGSGDRMAIISSITVVKE